MTDERAIRTICVAGAGVVGLSAAAAFARALPRTQLTVIETTPDPAALADVVPVTWPFVASFHSAIGVDEAGLVRTGIATHHLGTIFEAWPRGWTNAFGPYGKPVGAIPFDQIWLQAHLSGNALPYERYSMGAALARAGKFAHPSSNLDSITSRFAYGLHLDFVRYRERLRTLLARSCFISADIGSIERSECGGIAALRLTNGDRVEADLFIDCTGPDARLIGACDDTMEDWSAWMPFDRIAIEKSDRDGMPLPCDRVRAAADSWTVEWQLARQTIVARVGSTGTPIRRRRRLRPWVRNVVALGDAATAIDPLHGFNLDLAQRAILLALELLPGRDFPVVEIDEYNRRADQLTRRVRDFVALHYLRSGRDDGIWGELARVEPPGSLGWTLDQYGYRGRMPFHEDEVVNRDTWTSSMLGLGMIPRNIDPQARTVPLEQAIPAMERLVREIDDTADRVPSYSDYLQRITR